MQHRRNICQLTDALQSGAAEILSLLVHESRPGSCLGRAAGEYQDNIIFNQLLHQLNVSGIRANPGIIAPNHGHGASEHTGGNALDQGFGGSQHIHLGLGYLIQGLHDGLHRIAHGGLLLQLGNMYQLRLSVYKIFHRRAHDLLGVFPGALGVKADEIRIRHLGDGGGGDKLRVEAFA